MCICILNGLLPEISATGQRQQWSPHANWLPVPPLFKTLRLQTWTAESPPSSQISCRTQKSSSDPMDNNQWSACWQKKLFWKTIWKLLPSQTYSNKHNRIWDNIRHDFKDHSMYSWANQCALPNFSHTILEAKEEGSSHPFSILRPPPPPSPKIKRTVTFWRREGKPQELLLMLFSRRSDKNIPSHYHQDRSRPPITCIWMSSLVPRRYDALASLGKLGGVHTRSAEGASLLEPGSGGHTPPGNFEN